ncbi:hypothetical protein Gpo141_00003136 [Globisporangium polare]
MKTSTKPKKTPQQQQQAAPLATLQPVSVASAIEDRRAGVELAIEKYETLLAISKTKNPDFAFLDPQELMLRLAECCLCMSNLKKAVWEHSRHGDSSPANGTDPLALDSVAASKQSPPTFEEVQALLLKTRKLYQQRSEGIATFSEAIRLCYSVADEATESILTGKLQQLQLEQDALAYLDKLQDTKTENDSEKQILHSAFTKRAIDGLQLAKEQLRDFGADIGTQPALSEAEVDEIWKQMHDKPVQSACSEDTSCDAITFPVFWRWWMSESMNEFIDARRKRQK